ncbi:MAG TPA: hypothetical protein PLF42_06575 [Anaerolineales bacterium]|nr:hypothetical protein [Anaerolineales bacterium]
MKPRTYFGFALLFPYIFWGISMLVTFALSAQETSEAWNFVLAPFAFYALGIILWFIPYTILAIGMWVWSRNRTTSALFKAGIAAPLIFFVLMLIEVIFVTLPSENLTVFMQELLNQSVFLGILSLVYGYLCVGIALGIFKILQSRNLIAQEEPSPAV